MSFADDVLIDQCVPVKMSALIWRLTRAPLQSLHACDKDTVTSPLSDLQCICALDIKAHREEPIHRAQVCVQVHQELLLVTAEVGVHADLDCAYYGH